MRMLITGASGLLGADVALKAEEAGYEVIRHCNKARKGFVSADLSHEKDLQKLFSLDWDVVAHCAAQKNPEICEKEPDSSYVINVDASARIADFATKTSRKMLFISTDFVFDGKNPPYAETDTPSPLNAYGAQKAEAERQILSISSQHVILRVPILYGTAAGLDQSLLITSALNAINSKKACWMDTRIVRYPINTLDVSRALLLLLRKDAEGIFHVTGEDKTSKYGVCALIADILQKDISHIEPRESDPKKEASRPENAHLSMKKIQNLGFSLSKSLNDHMMDILRAGK